MADYDGNCMAELAGSDCINNCVAELAGSYCISNCMVELAGSIVVVKLYGRAGWLGLYQ